jgi:GNAT superfamily N-acetyltransferase
MADEHLTHGWEPELPAGDSVLRRFVLGIAARAETMATAVGGRQQRWDDLAVADPASPVFFDNAATLLQPPAYIDVDDAVARALEFYPPDRHFVLLSAWPTPDLTATGLELMGHPPFMVRPAGGTAPPPPAGLSIERVNDEHMLADFIATLTEGYPMPAGRGGALAHPSLLDGDIVLFVAYDNGRPVATAGAHVGCGVNDVEWVATLPSHRRRGIGSAVTWAATLVDPSLPAVLIASDDGQAVYEAMGYVRIQRLTMWHRPPASS